MPAIHVFAVAMCMGAPALAGPTSVGTPVSEVMRRTLGVSEFTIQRFEAPATPEEGFETTLNLGGAPVTINFVPTEIHAEDCVMSLDVGGPELIDVAPPPAGIYEGTVVGGPGTAIAQLVNGRFSTMVMLPGETWTAQPVLEVIPGADPSLIVVVSSEHVLGTGHVCGNPDPGHHGHHLPVAASTPGSRSHASDGGILECEVACESDYQFTEMHSLNASETAQDIARVMAWAGKYFTEGASVKFRITRYVIRLNPVTNPYSSSEAGVLLDQFSAHWNLKFQATQRDTAHLFTGRELNGSTIGIARLGVICTIPNAYGLSQSLYGPFLGRRASLSAHEIGHNFNAAHCDQAGSLCAPCRIMLAAQGIGIQNLSFGCSGPFIDFWAQGRTCLDLTDGGGAPCRTDLNFDGWLTIADFGAFQSNFVLGNLPLADFNYDGRLTASDYGAYQGAFVSGCP
jgi:hypothetical protein